MHLHVSTFRVILTVIVTAAAISRGHGMAMAQETSETAAVTEQADSDRDDPTVRKWIEDLGADSFAMRERAASRLIERGIEILPELREASANATDPEVRLRTEQLVRQLTEGDLQIRIDSFLAGDEIEFDGWRETQDFMGDSPSVREMFVELMVEHPDITKSLAGSPRERFMAMTAAMGRVQNKMFVQLEVPSRADVIALLLPANDPNVPFNQDFESLMISLLRKEAANRLHRDIQLGGPTDALVSGWLNRSSLNNRAETLFFAMSWDLQGALPLARRTLAEATSVETIAIALQTISRFGDKGDTTLVANLLDDTRVVSERGYARGEKLTTQLGDVAMATIALLHDASLADIGFARAEQHPTFSFLFDDLGFPATAADDEVSRKQVRERINGLIEKQSKNQESSDRS
ncbi:hypothetical protein [Novipirellula maiorica]|nr:hypothetical protein [Rhodopirellula maiorica]